MERKNFSNRLVAAASQFTRERDYWLDRLSGDLTKSCFPYDFNPGSSNTGKMDAVGFKLAGELIHKLMKLTNASNLRLYIVMVTGLMVFMYKYNSIEDIIVGAPIYKQNVEGKLINMVLALRHRLRGHLTFKELLLSVGNTIYEANENQNYPIETLLYKLNIPFSPEQDFPLFDAAILLENIHDKKYLQGINHNITLCFKRTEENIEGVVEYNCSLFTRTSIERIIKHFKTLLEKALFDINTRISSIDILSGEERKRLLYDFNNTNTGYSKDKVVHQLVEQQVERDPDNIAVVAEGKHLTYRELNNRANRLAGDLKVNGLRPNMVVNIIIEAPLAMTIGMLAVLKAGGAYMPTDPEYPEERKRYLWKDSGALFLLTQKHLVHRSGSLALHFPLGKIFYADNETGHPGEVLDLKNINRPGDLIYLLYTSGTTGTPKGIMVEHRNAVNVLCWFGKTYNLKKGIHVLQMTDYTFDPSVEDIFGTLIHGATLFVGSRDLIANKELFLEYAEANQIHLLNYIPTILKELLCLKKKINSLNIVISGGERLTDSVKEEILSYGYALYNHYGPTEITIDALTVRCSPDRVTLGRPIANTKCYILDKNNNPVPIGVIGELFIGGAGLARGYLNCPELTFEKFKPDLFAEGERYYMTGDLARWLTDGTVEFRGRADQQVKIRGYRIELGEIENHMLKHKEINKAVVTVREDKEGEPAYLCAYIVADRELGISQLREYLSGKLPGYMVPSYFVQLKDIQLTANGKIDRKALPAPELTVGGAYVAPGNETEKKLVEIWSGILNMEKEKISIESNFFELGGHSINALKMTSRIGNSLSVQIPIIELFKNPTIKGLSQYIIDIKNIKNTQKDFEKINPKLNENFRNVNLVKYIVGDKDYIVLYADKEIEAILNFIKGHLSEKYMPHFIRPFRENRYDKPCVHINRERFNEILKFRSIKLQDKKFLKNLLNYKGKKSSEIFKFEKINWQKINLSDFLKASLKKYIDIITDNNRSIYSIIKANKIIDRYNAGFFQVEKLRDGGDYKEAFNIEIEIEGQSNPEEIKQAIIGMFAEYPSLRTVLGKNNSTIVFTEYGSQLNDSDLVVIDLSIFDDEARSIICNLLSIYLSSMTLKNGNMNTLLFNIAVIRLNLQAFKLLLSINHIISDAKANEVLKKYYTEYFKSHRYNISNRLKYKDYLHYLSGISGEDSINQFKNCHEYKDFKKNVLAFREKYKIGNNLRFSHDVFIIQYYNDPALHRDYIQISFFIAVKIIKIIFNLNQIPIKFLSNKRIIGDLNFMNSLGIFQDYLLLLIDAEENSYRQMYSNKLHMEKKFFENGSHVRSLGIRDDEIRNVVKNAPFFFNFQGEKEFDIDFDSYVSGISNRGYKEYRVKSHYIKMDNRLIITFRNGIQELERITTFLATLNGDFKFKFVRKK